MKPNAPPSWFCLPLACGCASIVLAIVGTCRLGGGGLRAGGLLALPKERTEPVPLTNGGFEDGLTGWQVGREGAFALAESGARTGTACLRFDAGVATPHVPSARQTVKNVQPGVYRLRFWLAVRDLKPPARGQGGVRVSIEYHLKSGQRVWPSTEVFSGSFDWREVELSVLIPEDIKDATAVISVHRYGSPPAGTAGFDDFTLQRVCDPPVEAFLRYPNYRGFLPDDGPQRVRLWVKANQPAAREPVRVFVTEPATGDIVDSAQIAAGKTQDVIELDASDWPEGPFAVHASLGDYTYPPYIVRRITAEQRMQLAVWFDRHNVLHLNGQAVFPVGFYNTVAKHSRENKLKNSGLACRCIVYARRDYRAMGQGQV